jgi:choline dehydrogenase-like flavoprotein
LGLSFARNTDQSILVESVKFADKIAKAEPLASMLVARQDPSPDVKSDEDLTKWVKDNVRTLHHPIGTAAMAPKSLGGVVDDKLKVYGTSNLRVVCSISEQMYTVLLMAVGLAG